MKYLEANYSLIQYALSLNPIIYYPNGLYAETVEQMIRKCSVKLDEINRKYEFSEQKRSCLTITNDKRHFSVYLNDLNKRVDKESLLLLEDKIVFEETVIYLYERIMDYTDSVFTSFNMVTETHHIKKSFEYQGNTLTINNLIRMAHPAIISNEILDKVLPCGLKIPLINKVISLDAIVSNYLLLDIYKMLTGDKDNFNSIIVYNRFYDHQLYNSNSSLLNMCDKIIDLTTPRNKLIEYMKLKKHTFTYFN